MQLMKVALTARSAPGALVLAAGWAGILAGMLGAETGVARAQQPAAPSAKQQTPKQVAPVAPRSQGIGENADAGLRQRVEQLEEQLVDMQVMIGTLELLAKGGGGGAAGPRSPGAGGSGDGPRVDALESQVRQLSQQVEQLSAQVRSLGGRPLASAPRETSEPVMSSRPVAPRAAGGFGSTTVTPESGGSDAIGRVLQGGVPPASSASQVPPPAAFGGEGNPKQLYETAYGYLLQQDYVSAEAGFDEFLKRFPSDALAGNAQYWLGELFFVRGQYKAAAGAFLKGYQTYARSAKAPDSLLKLAMSLDRLGQKDAACSSFLELNAKFPQAPNYVKSRADNERRRLGCV